MRTFAGIELEAMKITRLFDRIPAGSVVAVQLGNSERWPEVLLALWRRGLVPMPLPDQVNETEMAVTLGTIRAAALVSNIGGPMTIHQRPVPPDAHVWRGPTPDLLKLTSGTTAAARAIRFRATQLLADCDAICSGMGITEHDLNYGVIPFAHSYGFSNLILPLIVHGVRLVTAPDRMPRAILDGLMATGATVFPGTPVFFQKLAEMDPLPELPALRLCISAGAPLPKQAAGLFTAKTKRKIHSFYGSSECGGISYDASSDRRYEEGFVGTPLPGVEIVHKGEEAAPIMVNGPAVGDGYFPNPDPVVLGNGTFTPGDLVRHGQRGLYLCGRTTDLINIAGRKLNPPEVEARIAECPGVDQVIVFGIPSALRGEEPVVAVTGVGLDPSAVQRFCQENLPAWQVPRAVWHLSDLPTSDRGKISRKSLANRYLAAHPQSSKL
jgi:acyl-CoA synthetase (AMP-forming)/AMP-acid ligase II